MVHSELQNGIEVCCRSSVGGSCKVNKSNVLEQLGGGEVVCKAAK